VSDRACPLSIVSLRSVALRAVLVAVVGRRRALCRRGGVPARLDAGAVGARALRLCAAKARAVTRAACATEGRALPSRSRGRRPPIRASPTVELRAKTPLRR